MVQLIVGKKGKGKTKQLLDKVNSEVKEISGSAVYEPERRQGILAADFPRSCKDLRLVRGIWKDGEVSFPVQHGSGALSSVLECNCLAEIRDRADGIRKGETVWVRMLGKRP